MLSSYHMVVVLKLARPCTAQVKNEPILGILGAITYLFIFDMNESLLKNETHDQWLLNLISRRWWNLLFRKKE